MPHALDGLLLVTNNKREAIAHAKEAARQGWTVHAKENKHAGYESSKIWTNVKS